MDCGSSSVVRLSRVFLLPAWTDGCTVDAGGSSSAEEFGKDGMGICEAESESLNRVGCRELFAVMLVWRKRDPVRGGPDDSCPRL